MAIFGRIRNDLKNLDRRNEEEQKVLDANFVSWYKGKIVLRIGGFRRRSFSFGALFIAPVESTCKDGALTVRHEYGHALQLEKLGLFRYIKHIAIPSLRSNGNAPPEIYYNAPHEITADILGGVERSTHTEEAKTAGLEWFRTSHAGPLTS